jgi:hypothetical protein
MALSQGDSGGQPPPVLIGHGKKETMKRRRNGKKWQQQPGETSQESGGTSGDPAGLSEKYIRSTVLQPRPSGLSARHYTAGFSLAERPGGN